MKKQLFWYVRLEVCEPQGDLREISLDELSEESQEQVMASIQEEVAQGIYRRTAWMASPWIMSPLLISKRHGVARQSVRHQ